MTDIDAVVLSPEEEALVRQRDQHSVTWEPGTVPRHVAEALWDAAFDRHRLLAALDAARADRDGLREAALELLYALDGLGPMGIRNAKNALHAALTAEAVGTCASMTGAGS